MKKRFVYLDYAAATPLDPRAAKAMAVFEKTHFGNPSSLHTKGRAAHNAVETARKDIADVFGARPKEIVFTGSGTESVALAILGVARMFPQKHVVTTTTEHASVLRCGELLEKEGHKVIYVPTDNDGLVHAEDIARAISKDTVLVSVVYVSSELGAVQPLRYVAKAIRKERARRQKAAETLPLYFHTDACQAAEYFPLGVKHLGVDLLTVNGSKIYGPKGIGVLYKRDAISLQPLWGGGGQEQGYRSGTEYVAGIVGLGKALIETEKRKQRSPERIAKLRNLLQARIKKLVPKVVCNGPKESGLRSPGTLHVSIPGVSSETAVVYLDEYGVQASTGSACNSNKENTPYATIEGIRFTMGRNTTIRDVQYTVHMLEKTVRILTHGTQKESR